VDVSLAFHPGPDALTGEIMLTALAAINIRFRGRTAHAGNTPWDGRSALKGAELFGAGVQFMR
jgi:aminobenzoyl-glutamate utilization protein B